MVQENRPPEPTQKKHRAAGFAPIALLFNPFSLLTLAFPLLLCVNRTPFDSFESSRDSGSLVQSP